MNLLFTSAGRRGYLLRYFREALAGEGSIHAANSHPSAPCFLEADYRFVSPLIYDSGYIDAMLAYCCAHHIHGLVPLFDIDIPVLGKHRDNFREVGTTVVCSSDRVAGICNDKWATYHFLLEHGFDAPLTHVSLSDAQAAITAGVLRFPVIVKPRWGMGSIGMYIAENAAELDFLYARVQRDIERSYLRYESATAPQEAVLVQEWLDGSEYGLDVVNDLQEDYVTTFVKRKLGMRSGETDSAVTVDDGEMRRLGECLSGALQHCGNLDADVFRTADDRLVVLEINARFGGGYPFSHLAGANLPRAILSWLRGETADPACFDIRPGITGVKDILPRVWTDA